MNFYQPVLFSKRAALTLIETMVVMIIAVAAMSAGAWMYSDYLDNQSSRTAAQQLRYVGDAFERYVYDNHAALLGAASASANHTVSVPFASLSPSYLPSSFQNKTPFGHEYVLAVRRPDPARNEIHALIYTQYTDAAFALEPARAQMIARLAGAAGGYTTAAEPGKVHTPYGNYLIEPSDFGALMGEGVLAWALFMQSPQGAERYLHRNATGSPEHNRMSTSIDMGGNNVESANRVSSLQLVTDALEASSIVSDTITATDSVLSESIYATGRIRAGEFLQIDGIATEGQACPESGLVGKNAAGLLLSCQSNLWGKLSLRLTGRESASGIAITPTFTYLHTDVNSISIYCRDWVESINADTLVTYSATIGGGGTVADSSFLALNFSVNGIEVSSNGQVAAVNGGYSISTSAIEVIKASNGATANLRACAYLRSITNPYISYTINTVS